MDPAEKTRENRLRRVAERRGFRLEKSRLRDPRAIGYGRYCIYKGMASRVKRLPMSAELLRANELPIAESFTWVNQVAVPAMTLDEVEAWLER
jgi:hypothetical protein